MRSGEGPNSRSSPQNRAWCCNPAVRCLVRGCSGQQVGCRSPRPLPHHSTPTPPQPLGALDTLPCLACGGSAEAIAATRQGAGNSPSHSLVTRAWCVAPKDSRWRCLASDLEGSRGVQRHTGGQSSLHWVEGGGGTASTAATCRFSRGGTHSAAAAAVCSAGMGTGRAVR